MKKPTAKRKISKILSETSPGIFSDQYWRGIHDIFDALRAQEFFPIINSAEYHHDLEGNPISKEWRFDIEFDGFTIHCIAIAHGAGSVNDPLSRYDISSYCW